MSMLSLFSITALSIFGYTHLTHKSSIAMSNVEALNVYASTIKCDGANEEPCALTNGDIIVLSKGFLRASTDESDD